ncbi:uncharacterized protein [Littorina saxatilis]|uniref:Uncharacterized protein n=1 Tax=Littorina saxatilis TaxID=31220 RepID=A0AAN9BNP8_9CAEN
MTSFKTDTQKLMFLVMLVVADSTRAMVLTLPTARSETVSSRQHGDLPAATSGTALRTVRDLNEDDRLTSHPTGTEDRLISHLADDRKRGFDEPTDTDPAPRNGKDLNENDRLTSHVTDDQKREFKPDPNVFRESIYSG